MKESSEHLLALVNSLLDFYRLDINKVDVDKVAFCPGELEFISAGQIDPDGNVELVFTHASDYTIVVDAKIMSDNGQRSEERRVGKEC